MSVARVFSNLGHALQQQSLILLSASISLAIRLATWAIGADGEFWIQPPEVRLLLTLVVVVQFWASLSVTATALTLMRSKFRWRPIHWVAPTTAFEIGLVVLGLAVPMLIGLVFLIVPGVWMALRWSQAGLLILDGHARWFAAAESSALLTRGRMLPLLGVWIILGLIMAALGWLGHTLDEVSFALGAPGLLRRIPEWTIGIVADAIGLISVAAIFHELSDRDEVQSV